VGFGVQAKNILNRLSNIFTSDPNSNLGSLIGAIGERLDAVDPNQTNLANQFSVSTATGEFLDMNGNDFGVNRRLGESDDDYRKRILAVVPIYTNGPTVPAISQIVQNFTGVAPMIIEFGPDGFTMGVSPMGQFIFDSDDNDNFVFQVQVQNPNNVPYKRKDLEQAVNDAKPARSTATFVHQGGV
jgi:hypothetical protein